MRSIATDLSLLIAWQLVFIVGFIAITSGDFFSLTIAIVCGLFVRWIFLGYKRSQTARK